MAQQVKKVKRLHGLCEEGDLIPGLTKWVKDLVLLQAKA